MKKKLPDAVLEYFRQQGKRGATMQAAAMTPEERKARATKASLAAALARTAKRKAAIEGLSDDLTKLERARARTKKKHAKKKADA
jgi:hypothetical protein